MSRHHVRKFTQLFGSLTLVLITAHATFGYSVLTHEAIIDSSWDNSIKPILLKKYPRATAEQLREAHAQAFHGRCSSALLRAPTVSN